MNNKFLIAFVSCMVLAGCAKREDRALDETATQKTTETAVTETAENTDAAPEAADVNTTPVTEQKPKTILNPVINPAEAGRRMVRQAHIDFSAQDVVKTALAIDKLTLESGGFVEQKDIDFNVIDLQKQKIADGKIRVFEKVNPVAQMTLRIPSEKAASFVNQLLPLMFFLNQQQYSAKRYELTLLEEKIAQTQSLPSNSKNPQLNEIARLTQLEVQDRVRYSTIMISISQPTLVRERLDIDINEVARLNGDGFWESALNSVITGWQFVLNILIFLIAIWPFYLFLILAILLFKIINPIVKRLINK